MNSCNRRLQQLCFLHRQTQHQQVSVCNLDVSLLQICPSCRMKRTTTLLVPTRRRRPSVRPTPLLFLCRDSLCLCLCPSYLLQSCAYTLYHLLHHHLTPLFLAHHLTPTAAQYGSARTCRCSEIAAADSSSASSPYSVTGATASNNFRCGSCSATATTSQPAPFCAQRASCHGQHVVFTALSAP